MIRRPPRSTLSSSSAASDVYKRQSSEWLAVWRAYTAAGSLSPPPGPVSNHVLLSRSGEPLPGLEKVEHYRGINCATWKIFIDCHGGGPEIRRKDLDLYAEEPPDPTPDPPSPGY
eukprot:TRINITY_DN32913_c0_g1_i1.p1 TRINITY_DN32913_c0_g1~~TRINITY_DN32913_c0_g1_i1.p1  ORF type:complete len:115 (-),score=14.14 TRINITY_DN32913_c0_g1_i1:45-389(-)